MHHSSEIYLEEINGDGVYTLEKLKELVEKAQLKYGKHAFIRFDAGHNNVQVMVVPIKQQNR